MILTNGSLYWPTTVGNTTHHPPLSEDISCDVLVIGGGMGGSLISRLLTDRQVDTVLIDKREVAHGSSSASTGLLQYSNDKSLTSFMNTFGEENGVLFYKLCQQSLEQLETLSKSIPTDPKFIRRSSLYYASIPEDVPKLQAEYEQLRANDFPVEYWSAQDISQRLPFTRPAALYTKGDAEVNPFRFALGLLQSAVEKGLRIYEHTEAKRLEFLEDGVLCHSPNGRIRAQRVVISTGYETQEIKRDAGAVLVSSYAIVTKPVDNLDDWYERCLIWETARPYLYMRTTVDNRIICGGLDEEVLIPEERERRIFHQQKVLLQRLQEHFPRLEPQIDFAWGAVFGSTHDGLPYIGSHPRFPHCYFLEGYGGNGAVTSMMAAQLLTDEITGTSRPELKLFSLTRTTKPSPRHTNPMGTS